MIKSSYQVGAEDRTRGQGSRGQTPEKREVAGKGMSKRSIASYMAEGGVGHEQGERVQQKAMQRGL